MIKQKDSKEQKNGIRLERLWLLFLGLGVHLLVEMNCFLSPKKGALGGYYAQCS
jgi:hypothetical protein